MNISDKYFIGATSIHCQMINCCNHDIKIKIVIIRLKNIGDLQNQNEF